MSKKSRHKLEDEFINTFTKLNLIEKLQETYGDRHEHITGLESSKSILIEKLKNHMKKCEEIITNSTKEKKT